MGRRREGGELDNLVAVIPLEREGSCALHGVCHNVIWCNRFDAPSRALHSRCTAHRCRLRRVPPSRVLPSLSMLAHCPSVCLVLDALQLFETFRQR